MSLEINNLIIVTAGINKDLTELYHLLSLGDKPKAVDLALSINQRLLNTTMLSTQIAQELIKTELEETVAKQPKLRLVE